MADDHNRARGRALASFELGVEVCALPTWVSQIFSTRGQIQEGGIEGLYRAIARITASARTLDSLLDHGIVNEVISASENLERRLTNGRLRSRARIEVPVARIKELADRLSPSPVVAPWLRLGMAIGDWLAAHDASRPLPAFRPIVEAARHVPAPAASRIRTLGELAALKLVGIKPPDVECRLLEQLAAGPLQVHGAFQEPFQPDSLHDHHQMFCAVRLLANEITEWLDSEKTDEWAISKPVELLPPPMPGRDPADPMPFWDSERNELWYRGKCLLRTSGAEMGWALSRFQDHKWHCVIDASRDAMGKPATKKWRERVIRSLNEGIQRITCIRLNTLLPLRFGMKKQFIYWKANEILDE